MPVCRRISWPTLENVVSIAQTPPIIDLSPLSGECEASRRALAARISAACRDTGFFYLTGHGISTALIRRLDEAARAFFALPETEKMKIAMARSGVAWRGYFPVGGELTSGVPDLKEGLYFGEEHAPDHPGVLAGRLLHGANLLPDEPQRLAGLVYDYMRAAGAAAGRTLEAIALSLGLEPSYFRDRYTAHPTVLFRIFHYPPQTAAGAGWGVGEHTDYGLLTLLAQDEAGGLEVKTSRGWIEAPPIEGALICNIGDMLDRLTGGFYRSTPHRVRNRSGRSRLSFPFFYDPAFDAEIEPLPQSASPADDSGERWDRASVHAFEGTYGDYLCAKVSKVFPALRDAGSGATLAQ